MGAWAPFPRVSTSKEEESICIPYQSPDAADLADRKLTLRATGLDNGIKEE
jgi:hypothetical protein